MTRQLIRIAAVLVTMLFSAGAAFAEGFKIVVHPSNNLSSATKSEISDYLLKRKVTWPNGTPVVPVDQPEKSAVRAAVLRDVFGRSASAIKSYWQQQIFSGRAIPPTEKASDQEVIAFVQASPGAIGYVSQTAEVRGVTVITVR
jgi:ABC-type phosphate transport system substrate-binding protein